MKSGMKRLAMLALGASAVVLVTAGGSALADDHGNWRRGSVHQGDWHHDRGRHGKMYASFMRRYDANKDGKVTQEEIDTNRVARHGKYDANGDGKLSLEEFQGLWLEAYRRKMVREFQRFDVDGDAAVTLEEYTLPMSKAAERRHSKGRHGMHHKAAKRHDRKGRHDMHHKSPAPSDSKKLAQ